MIGGGEICKSARASGKDKFPGFHMNKAKVMNIPAAQGVTRGLNLYVKASSARGAVAVNCHKVSSNSIELGKPPLVTRRPVMPLHEKNSIAQFVFHQSKSS